MPFQMFSVMELHILMVRRVRDWIYSVFRGLLRYPIRHSFVANIWQSYSMSKRELVIMSPDRAIDH
jgi:hypothetical protein